MRKNDDQIILLGRNTVADALRSDRNITRVIMASDIHRDGRIGEIVDLARKKSVPVSFIRPQKFEYFDNQGSSQGVAALMEKPQNLSIEHILSTKENPVFFLFNRLDYEANLGAILRASWAAGIDAVVCSPNGVSEITPQVSKISQGGAAYVPLIRKGLLQVIDVLKRHHIPIVGVEVGQGLPYYQQNLLGPVAFVFGGESAGFSEPLARQCDLFIHIPMTPGIASLNVAVTATLVMFEKRRQEATKRS